MHTPAKTDEPTKKSTEDIINYAWQLKKNGRTDSTIETTVARLTRLTKLCDIYEPEQVKAVLAKATWKNATKELLVTIYSGFLKYIGKEWQKPAYKRDSELPFIPTEQEIDALINNGALKTTALLQLLKETGARIGEADSIKWTDIDIERKTIIIHAEKGSNTRILPISAKLIAILHQLPRTSEDVFQTKKNGMRRTFEGLRKRTAKKLDNPRLNKITFHTFRHWKGTTEYHKTKDIVHVMKILGHRSIRNTMIYINIESMLYLASSDEWTCKATTDDNEATKLIEAGFEYVMTTPNGLMQFRKRK